METQFIYIVKGVKRHFTGDCEISIVAARREEKDAIKVGAGWAKSENEWAHAQNRNIHASYVIVKLPLL